MPDTPYNHVLDPTVGLPSQPQEDATTTQPPVVVVADLPSSGIGTTDDRRGYYAYGITVSHIGHEGVQLGHAAAQRNVPAEVLRHSSFVGYKVVTAVGQRRGRAPLMPSIEPASDNEVLLDWIISDVMPSPFQGGTILYTVVCQYVYGYLKPPDLNTSRYIPQCPVNPDSLVQLSPSDFTNQLIRPITPVT